MKRKLPVIIVLLLSTALLLVSCDDASDHSGTASVVSSASQDVSENEVSTYTADIPEGFSYEGHTVKILSIVDNVDLQQTFEFGYNKDELETSVLNDAIYARNDFAEEKLHCKINEYVVGRTYNGVLYSTLYAQTQAGTADYAFVSCNVQETTAAAIKGMFYNLYGIENLSSLEDAWWDADYNAAAEISGKLYCASGAVGFRNLDMLSCLLINKDMFSELGLESPYDIVRAHQWTFDLVTQWSKLVSADFNSDGVINYKDKFGMGGQSDNMWSMFYSGGGRTVTLQDDDSYKVTLASEHGVDVADAVLELMQNKAYFVNANDYWYEPGYTTSPCELVNAAFLDDRCLLYSGTLSGIADLRDMETDYGILPMPLYDENQEEYCSFANPWAGSVFSIPYALEQDEAERSAVLLQVLGAEGLNSVIPAYYEVCLKGQRTRDDDSIEMLDLIRSTAGCDLGQMYNWAQLGFNVLHASINASAGSYVSLVQQNQSAIESAIKSTVEAFESLN